MIISISIKAGRCVVNTTMIGRNLGSEGSMLEAIVVHIRLEYKKNFIGRLLHSHE